jgi:predicted ester cyclase
VSSTEQTRAFMQRYFESLGGLDRASPDFPQKLADVIDRFIASKDLKEHIAGFSGPFPGYEVIPDEVIVEGDKAVVRMTFRGVHKGDLMGIPPTGRQVSAPAVYIYTIRDDKIVAFWGLADTTSILQQIGGMPAPSAAAA